MLTDFIPDFEAIRDELQAIAHESDGWLDPDDLMGCCAIGAKRVYDWLNAQGITTKVVHNSNHFWCRAIGYTIDLTASQFYLDAIYIYPVGDEAKHECYNDAIEVADFTQEYFSKMNWPDEQNPWTYEEKIYAEID